MPELTPTQIELLVAIFLIPLTTGFLTDRIGKIRSVLEAVRETVATVRDRLAFVDTYLKVLREAKAMAVTLDGEIESMLKDGKFDESEVKRLGAMAKSLIGKLDKD